MFDIKGTKVIRVKGIDYTIMFVDKLINICGLTDSKNKEIYIEIDEDKEEMNKTIIHELIHAFFDECGLKSYSNDEVLVNWLECNFFEIYNQFEKCILKK